MIVNNDHYKPPGVRSTAQKRGTPAVHEGAYPLVPTEHEHLLGSRGLMVSALMDTPNLVIYIPHILIGLPMHGLLGAADESSTAEEMALTYPDCIRSLPALGWATGLGRLDRALCHIASPRFE